MIDVSRKVINILKELNVDYYYVHSPADSKLPCIVYSEMSNNDYDLYNNMELSEIVYSFTIYSIDPEFLIDTVQTLDALLYNNGFLKRNVSQDQYIEPCYVKTLNYSILVNKFYNR